LKENAVQSETEEFVNERFKPSTFRKVYETEPLICPKCHGQMRIISLIDRLEIIKKILET